jgi:hypothetical protein
VFVAVCQNDEFILFIQDVHSNVLPARFKSKRGMLSMPSWPEMLDIATEHARKIHKNMAASFV